MALTTQMRVALKEIVENKYASGPFAGMVFNAQLSHPEKSTEQLVEQALTVRLKMEDLILWPQKLK